MFGQFTECLPLELKPVICKFPHPPSSTGSSLLESDKHIPGLRIPPGCFRDPFPRSLRCCKDDVAQVQRLDPPSVHCVSFLGCFSGEEVVHETASLPPSQGLELVVAWSVPPAELNRCPVQLRRMLCCREDLMGKAFMQHMSRMMFVLTRCAHFWQLHPDRLCRTTPDFCVLLQTPVTWLCAISFCYFLGNGQSLCTSCYPQGRQASRLCAFGSLAVGCGTQQ